MALRNVLLDSEELLHKKSRKVDKITDDIWELLDDMKETVRKNNGAGLAAPQVGVLKRIAVVEISGMYIELINPKIIYTEGTQQTEEGCLSVKSFTGLVTRPYKITVSAEDRYGYPFQITVEDAPATCFCHEIDHLDGILFTDKADSLIPIEKG